MKKYLQRILACLTLCAVLAGSLAVPASAASFRDVPASHWAAESIQRCVEQGFFKGQSAERFGLGQEMSRAAFAVVLCRFFGWETGTPSGDVYSDVPANAWYAGAVETAYEHGALTDQQETFRPNDPIIREELAVMLVRAMGYGSIAGLAQDLPMPFKDVTTNVGYIAMAYGMGLVNGTSGTTFSPKKTATREQVAVILMRIYDKLHGSEPEKIGVVSTACDMTGLDIVAIPAARAFALTIKDSIDPERAAALQSEARAMGAQVYLYMEVGTAALGSDPDRMGALLAETVTSGGYDGLILDAPRLGSKNLLALNRLAKAVDQCLGKCPFYLVVESPTRGGKTYEGYDYKTLAGYADKLVLRIALYEERGEQFTTAPVDPLEEICYALATLKAELGTEKLVLMLDTETDSWVNGSRSSLPAEGLAELLGREGTQTYYSDRYACAYLTGTDVMGKSLTAWYLDQKSVETRVQLARGFGVKQICLSDWDAASEEFLAGLK